MKLDTAKGTRDFPPEEKILRDTVLNTLKEVCENYGFNPLETPIIENYDTLAAKFAAGQESDALEETFTFEDRGKRMLGLRYDLTVPFSRYMAMNPQVKMPFKKYLTGEVFRDGPIKKGRYRQFTQFDPDIVGCESMTADAEVLSLACTVLEKLDLAFYFEVNNRKIIDGVMVDAGIKEKDWFKITVSIDKLKKIGKEGVTQELRDKGFKKDVIAFILETLEPKKTPKETLEKLREMIKNDRGIEGVKEMEELINLLAQYNVKDYVFDPTLARGLAYYTGPIYEFFLKDSQIKSSIVGGGRYDELIGDYLGKDEIVPATGLSFGIEVIIEAMKEMDRAGQQSITKVYVIPIKAFDEALSITQQMRSKGINTDIDLMQRGISSNLQFADTYSIPYVLFIGKRELAKGKVKLRDMQSGDESLLSVEEVLKKLS